jgi:hypothetical protein
MELKDYIGDIVILKISHIKNEEDFSDITIAGDSNYITPLMVVKEVLDSKPDKIDGETGQLKNSKGNLQFRCIWFSPKQFKFEEGWFYQKELINLSKTEIKSEKEFENQVSNSNKSNNLDGDHPRQFDEEKVKINLGDKVVFKTNDLELKKRKTFLEIDQEKINNKITALLSFCSPVFVVIGFSVVEKKEPLIDSHTGQTKRAYGSKLVKLKSFNSNENKFSEFLVPYESIQKIEEIDDEKKNLFIESKGGKKLIVRRKKDRVISETENKIHDILMIDSISSLSGIYRANVSNIFSQKKEIIKLDNAFEVEGIDISETSVFPEISESGGEFSVNSIEDRLKLFFVGNTYSKSNEINLEYINNLKIKKLIKINYKNKFEKTTIRYCIPIFLFKVNKQIEDSKGKTKNIPEYYLQSYCLLRSEYRNFKVERMLSMEEISEENIIAHAFDKWNEFINN